MSDDFRGTSPMMAHSATVPVWLLLGIALLGTIAIFGPLPDDRRRPIDEVLILLGTRAALVVMVPAFVLAWFPTRLVVDATGIHIRWLWRKRFVPHEAIIEMAAEADDLEHASRPPRWLRIRHAGGTEIVGMPDANERARFIGACSARRQALAYR